MPEKLKVLIVAAELTPLAKVGGLADVIGSLPKALASLNVDVRIAIPKYDIIDEKKYPSKKIAENIEVGFEGNKENFTIFETALPSTSSHSNFNIPVYLISHPKFPGSGGVYPSPDASSDGSLSEIHRFGFFTKAVMKISKPLNWKPDVIHCHDWHVAMLPALTKLDDNPCPTLLTIHNLAYQGNYPADVVLKIFGEKITSLSTIQRRLDNSDTINFLEQGILNAGLLNTVSPAYASEILTSEFGCGLEKALDKRRPQLSGILNGLDTERFNPQTDTEINHNFLATNLIGKIRNKKDLQAEGKLKIDEKIPVIGMISRLAEQKGLDIILPIMKKLIKQKAQFVFLGTGDPRYEKELKKFNKKKNVFVNIGFDPKLAQLIYAGSDIFLMPSRFEPCGLGQMISMRYGTLPIVRATGGLKDTVTEITSHGGTGFTFNSYDKETLLKTINRAIGLFLNDQETWQKAIKEAMAQNFSWDISAKKYLELYQKLS